MAELWHALSSLKVSSFLNFQLEHNSKPLKSNVSHLQGFYGGDTILYWNADNVAAWENGRFQSHE